MGLRRLRFSQASQSQGFLAGAEGLVAIPGIATLAAFLRGDQALVGLNLRALFLLFRV